MRPIQINGFFILVALVFLSNCSYDETSTVELPIPDYYPEMHIPEHNQLSDARIELGKKLFFDPKLSRDNQISCGSCHLPSHAFADTTATSKGVYYRIGKRNTPTVLNIGFHPLFNLDGGVFTLELQAFAPIEAAHEMDQSLEAIVTYLQQSEDYSALFKSAYQEEPSASGVAKALATYQRTLLSYDSPYEQYTYKGKSNALSSAAVRGKTLFFDKLKCDNCHRPPLFTTFEFANNGIAVYSDSGRAGITGNPVDFGTFKIPSLKNVALTPPYMHNGKFKTLKEVIQHYKNGGESVSYKDKRITGFNLSEQEAEDLEAFLLSLTDTQFHIP